MFDCCHRRDSNNATGGWVDNLSYAGGKVKEETYIALDKAKAGVIATYEGAMSIYHWTAPKLGVAAEWVGDAIKSTAIKIGTYIKDNWKTLLPFVIGWGLIVACIGGLYGFHFTARPFTLGMGYGAGIGVLIGGATVKLFPNDETKKSPNNNLWGLILTGIWKLDEGTRMLLVPVLITVITAAIPVFPTIVGGFIGVLIFDKVAVDIGYGKEAKQPPADLASIAQGHEELSQEQRKLQGEVETLSQQVQRLQERLRRSSQQNPQPAQPPPLEEEVSLLAPNQSST